MVDKIGFIGLGVMGQPMAQNIVKTGAAVVVWSRTAKKCDALSSIGAEVAQSAAEVFSSAAIVILMLADDVATDSVLGRGTDQFQINVSDRIVVNMGTTSAEYSSKLYEEVRKAGGQYVEAPVSGSRKPAESGQLVGMVAGDDSAVEAVVPILKHMCSNVEKCGKNPSAILMKLSVNLFLITMVSGLMESMHFAERHQINIEQLRNILAAGPMASVVSKGKADKLVARDFAVQAAIFDVLKNNRLIAEAARKREISSPLLDVCYQLFQETLDLGYANEDMIAVYKAIERRSNLST